MPFFILLFFFFLLPILISATTTAASLNICEPTARCRSHGPLIRFPFRLVTTNAHPQNCSSISFTPSFDLHCNENRQTILQLPSSVNLSVRSINYRSQTILLHDQENCLARKLRTLNLSASPFTFNDSVYDYVLFNCSTDSPRQTGPSPIGCLGVDGYQVIPVGSDDFTDNFPLTNCTRVLQFRSVPFSVFAEQSFRLSWTEPDCRGCEDAGQYCSLNTNATAPNQILCFDKPKEPSKTPLIAGATVGSVLFVAVLAAVYYVYRSIKTDKKIEKFLKDYEALRPMRFSYADIKRITKDFSEKLGEGGYGIVYKGKLSNEIYVAVKVLNNAKGNGEEFVNEVGTIGSIHHVNVVRLVGFCADGFRRALVYDYLPNESLEKFIFQNSPKRNSLSWEKMLDISIGIAKGIEYLHQGCDQQILHFDIKPHNILLDQNLNPKICDFGLAKFCSKEQSAVSMTDARGTMGYIAPEMMSRTFGRVSYKSDVYSFGMMLLEMVGGRKNIDVTLNKSEVYFPKWIYNQLSEGGEVLARTDDTMARKLVFVGLWCIQWYPADRPSMKTVVQMLEGDVENLSLPPNPFPATNNAAGANGRYETELAIVPESDDKLI